MGEGVSCSELSVPRRWAVPNLRTSNPYDSIFLSEWGFRLSDHGFALRQGPHLLLGVVTTKTPDRLRTPLYSPDVYAIVQQKGKAILQRASEDEWNAARVLPQSRQHALGSIRVLDPESRSTLTGTHSSRPDPNG